MGSNRRNQRKVKRKKKQGKIERGWKKKVKVLLVVQRVDH